jgi:methylenetetrahydrofolate reductase (NADPH)
LALNARGWWTVASQPAVNGCTSSDPCFGWGPRNGFVFQKPFVEVFVPASDWTKLEKKLKSVMGEISFYAADSKGNFTSSAGGKEEVNAVTWGAFPGKEIVTPTIVEEVSFKAWAEEAFSIWSEWKRCYRRGTGSWNFLETVREDVWLVNVICHAYVEPDRLWDILLKE